MAKTATLKELVSLANTKRTRLTVHEGVQVKLEANMQPNEFKTLMRNAQSDLLVIWEKRYPGMEVEFVMPSKSNSSERVTIVGHDGKEVWMSIRKPWENRLGCFTLIGFKAYLKDI